MVIIVQLLLPKIKITKLVHIQLKMRKPEKILQSL